MHKSHVYSHLPGESRVRCLELILKKAMGLITDQTREKKKKKAMNDIKVKSIHLDRVNDGCYGEWRDETKELRGQGKEGPDTWPLRPPQYPGS